MLLHLVLFSFFSTHLFCQVKPMQAVNPGLKARRLLAPINSSDAELAPVRYGDRIFFSSFHREDEQGVRQSGIFSFMPGAFPRYEAEINLKKKNYRIESLTMTPDAMQIYFSLCSELKPYKCEIWLREREYDGGWGTAKKLPDEINLRGYTAMQPSVGWDRQLKMKVLYFVSDRPGGAGKMDIWYSPITWDGKFETPIPFPFNTAENDLSPYFHKATQTLYFSSDGLEGLGGQDIYQASKMPDGKWTLPENMGRPFNSAYDDLYFSFHERSQTAYFSSNRPGSICNSSINEAACFDLYEIVFPEVLYLEATAGLAPRRESAKKVLIKNLPF